jgi:hypothetical protein
LYENRANKPVEIALNRGREEGIMMVGDESKQGTL